MNFNNKNIVITGSSAGIGKACADLFMSLGGNVIINGSSVNGKKVANSLNKKYASKAVFIRADVSTSDGREFLFKESYKHFKKIDILVNCAGIVPEGTVLDNDENEFVYAFNTNVKSVFFLSQKFISKMLNSKKGVIINIGSIAGLIGPKNRALYSASKGAVISLTRAMASDFADTGIRINCVCPGMIDTPSLEKRINSSKNPIMLRKDFENNIPIKRIGNAKEIASLVCFVASDENSFMTGSIISSDGGASL